MAQLSQIFELLISDLIHNTDLIFQLSISDLSCILFSNFPETNVERGEREEECEGVVEGEGCSRYICYFCNDAEIVEKR